MQLGSKQLTQKELAQVKACKTPEELLELAKANGVELSEEDALAFLEIFTEEERAEGELADAELDNVAGGANPSSCTTRCPHEIVEFYSPDEVWYLFNVGDKAEAFVTDRGNYASQVSIIERRVENKQGRFYDQYRIEPVEESGFSFEGWHYRNKFRKYH